MKLNLKQITSRTPPSTLKTNALKAQGSNDKSESLPTLPVDQAEISGKQVITELGKTCIGLIKEAPKALLNHGIGSACAIAGVLGGAIYSATLVGPIVSTLMTSENNQPSLEEAVQRNQLPLAGNVAMGSADAVNSAATGIGTFGKEMAAPITWGVKAFQAGYHILD